MMFNDLITDLLYIIIYILQINFLAIFITCL